MYSQVVESISRSLRSTTWTTISPSLSVTIQRLLLKDRECKSGRRKSRRACVESLQAHMLTDASTLMKAHATADDCDAISALLHFEIHRDAAASLPCEMQLLRGLLDTCTPSSRARLGVVSRWYLSQNERERIYLREEELRERDRSRSVEKKVVLYDAETAGSGDQKKRRSNAQSVKLIDDVHVQRLRTASLGTAKHETLREFVQDARHLHLTWQKLYEAALTLKHLHAQKIVHGRLQCCNILISTDGTQTARVRNFGPQYERAANDDAVRWSSPECLDGARATCASDVFAFGMCILEAVTGADPWGTVSSGVVRVMASMGRLPKRPDALVMRDEQWALIASMCAKEPSQRVHMPQVVKSLRQFAQEEQETRVRLQRDALCVLYDATSL